MYRLRAGLMMTILCLGSTATADQVEVDSKGHVYHPVFSKDGQYLAFELNSHRGRIELFISALHGDHADKPEAVVMPATSVFASDASVAINATWHPMGILVFEGSNPGGHYRLYYQQPGTGGVAAELVPAHEVTGHLMFPDLTLDGGRLAFVSKAAGQGDIQVLSTHTSMVDQLTATQGTESFPTFSPDGSSMVFSRVNEGQEDLYTIDGEGLTERLLLAAHGDQTRPAYGMDGKRLLFFDSSRTRGEWDLVSTEVDGTGARVLAEDVALPLRSRPAVSPDGEWVAYSYADPRLSDAVWLVKVDGSARLRVAQQDWVACGEPALGKQGEQLLLAFTAIPADASDYRQLVVQDITALVTDEAALWPFAAPQAEPEGSPEPLDDTPIDKVDAKAPKRR